MTHVVSKELVHSGNTKTIGPWSHMPRWSHRITHSHKRWQWAENSGNELGHLSFSAASFYGFLKVAWAGCILTWCFLENNMYFKNFIAEIGFHGKFTTILMYILLKSSLMMVMKLNTKNTAKLSSHEVWHVTGDVIAQG